MSLASDLNPTRDLSRSFNAVASKTSAHVPNYMQSHQRPSAFNQYLPQAPPITGTQPSVHAALSGSRPSTAQNQNPSSQPFRGQPQP
jgi:hypothetical protein